MVQLKNVLKTNHLLLCIIFGRFNTKTTFADEHVILVTYYEIIFQELWIFFFFNPICYTQLGNKELFRRGARQFSQPLFKVSAKQGIDCAMNMPCSLLRMQGNGRKFVFSLNPYKDDKFEYKERNNRKFFRIHTEEERPPENKFFSCQSKFVQFKLILFILKHRRAIYSKMSFEIPKQLCNVKIRLCTPKSVCVCQHNFVNAKIILVNVRESKCLTKILSDELT